MEVIEVVRRWQAGESQRGIARATGLSRNTVEKYVRANRDVAEWVALFADPILANSALDRLANGAHTGSNPAAIDTSAITNELSGPTGMPMVWSL